MPRPAKYSSAQIIAATKRLLGTAGPDAATIQAIAAEVGAPVGSIYHRVPSRSLLLAQVWLDIVESFQSRVIGCLDEPDVIVAGRRVALFTPSWARSRYLDARVLLLHRREDLIGEHWPTEVAERAMRAGEQIEAALLGFTRRRFGRVRHEALRRVRFALVDVPIAAVRPHLQAGESPPRVVDRLIEETYSAVLGRNQ